MTLWDVEVGTLEDELQACSRDSLRVLGLKVIEGTSHIFGQPLPELFDPSTVDMIDVVVSEFNSVPEPSESVSEKWTSLFVDLDSWQDSRFPLTVASYMQAIAQYGNFLFERDGKNELIESLSSCYESVLSFARIGRRITIEMERDNSYCVEAIQLQKSLIRQICGIS